MKTIGVVLYDGFTTLDALGPTEVLSKLSQVYEIQYGSLGGGLVSSSTQNRIDTQKLEEFPETEVLLIPGGFGARALVDDRPFLEALRRCAEKSRFVLCVCTGSALLARTGLLDGRRATSNKMAWPWVIAQRQEVQWIKKARWVVDGTIYTSSGITAGIDMALGFVADQIGVGVAKKISNALEYVWNQDKDEDPFSEALP